MTNKEKFLQLVSETDTKTMENIRFRIAKRDSLKDAQNSAIRILVKMDYQKMSVIDLSGILELPLCDTYKILSGKDILSDNIKEKISNFLEN